MTKQERINLTAKTIWQNKLGKSKKTAAVLLAESMIEAERLVEQGEAQ